MIRNSLVLKAHGRHAYAVLFTPDSSLLVSAGIDAAIRLWRVPGFEAAGEFTGHPEGVTSLALAPGGAHLAASCGDGTARIWSFPDGTPLHRFPGHRLPRWSPSGRLFTTLSTEGQVTQWAAADYHRLDQLPPLDRRVLCFEYPPDETELLIGGAGTIFRVGGRDDVPRSTLTGHGAAVLSLALSPDRSLLASTGAEGALRFWQTAGWELFREVVLHSGGRLALAWSPGGDWVAVSGDDGVQIVPVSAARPRQRIEVAARRLYGIAVSPDGQWLASAGGDGRVRLWALSA